MPDHDNGYKLLFSHAELVADLIHGFVREDWVADLDLATLEKTGAGYVSDELRNRESDMVWRVRWGKEDWLYVYLMLEFQSTVDPYMAVRMLTYVGLLYQDLIRQRALAPSGKLPPVLPLVLYNGNGRWGAAQEMAELVVDVPGRLERYRPRLRYFLLDEGRLAQDEELGSLRNLAAVLFRLERSRSSKEVARGLAVLVELLPGPERAPLRRAFLVWFEQVFLPARMPGVEIPGMTDLQEVKSMLEERVVEWTREWEQNGIEKGRMEAMTSIRGVLERHLESRFGPLPESVRERLAAIRSTEVLAELLARVPQAPSLAALDLA